MNRIFVLVFVLSKLGAQVTYTWTGANSNNFSNLGNWSPTATLVPGSILGDDVVFDGTSSVTCNLDVNITVHDFLIKSSYLGTIDAQSSLPTITNSFIQNGGTFIATSLNMDVSGNTFSITGGTFTHNGGDVTIYVGIGLTWVIAGSPIFNNLFIMKSTGSNTTERIINFGSCSAINLILDGSAAPYSYMGNVDILSGLTMLGTSTGTPTTNSGTFTFSGAGPLAITGAGAAARNKLPNIVVNTTGSISITGHVNIQGNWTGTQGTLTIGSSTENFYGTSVSINGTASAFDNIGIQPGASVSFPTAEVKVGRSLINSGSVSFASTGAIGLNGPSVQTVSLTTATLAAINGYNTGSARAVTLVGAINILDSISAQTNVTFNTGGNLTLKSTASLKGRVGRVGGTVSGNVIVETFIPGPNTGWTNLGINGVNGQTIANWDTQIPMTCDGCFYSPGAIPGNFYSIQGWNEAICDYDTTITSATALTPGTGFWVYVGSANTTTSDFTLVNTGTLKQGSGTIPVTSSGTISNIGSNLIANPYASPVSWTKFRALGTNSSLVGAQIDVYNADLGVTTSYVAGASSPGGGAIGDNIPAGQGFYVVANGAGSLTYDESIKTNANTGTTPLLRTSSNNDIGKIFRIKLKGANDWDATVFRIHKDATPHFDMDWDAHKIFQSPGYIGYPGTYTHYTTISSRDDLNKNYSINSIPLLYEAKKIPLLVKVSTTGSYTISSEDFEGVNACLGLLDKLTNTYTDLRQGTYVCQISDTTSVPRFELFMCKDESLNTVGMAKNEFASSILIAQDNEGAFVKTSFEQKTNATIGVYNIMGQQLIKDIQVDGLENTTRLNIDLHNQVVLVKVTTDKESSVKKLVLR